MFADDMKIYSVIESFDDSLKLQHDIDKLMQWLSIDLDIVNEEKELGVWCTNDLKPSLHCQKLQSRLRRFLVLLEELLRLMQLTCLSFYTRCMLGFIWNIVCKLGVPTWPGTLIPLKKCRGVQLSVYKD